MKRKFEPEFDPARTTQMLESGDFLAKILENIHLGIVILDLEFNFLYINQIYAGNIQRSREELVGQNYFDLYPSEENEAIFRKVALTGQPYFAYSKPFKSEHGIAYLDWSLQPAFGPEGNIAYLVLMLKDVTQQDKARNDLNRSQQLFSRVFSLAPDANILIDAAGNITTMNEAAVRMFGYTADEMVGEPIEKLIPERFQKKHGSYWKRYQPRSSLRTTGTVSQLFGLHKNGKEFPVEILLSSLYTGDGELTLSVIRDISQQKETEAELTEVRRRLLIGAESERVHLAQELHDSIIQDLYGALYQVQLLKDELSPEGKQTVIEVVETIKKVNNRLRETIANLRPTTLIALGLEKSIRSYASRFQEAFPEIQLELELEEDQQHIPESIRLGLYRIYTELLSNAAEHSDAEHIWVRLLVKPREVVLEVQDDGKGFSVPKRWIKFARDGRLGLIDVTERAQTMGGSLKIESRPGRGTTIRSVVPLYP